MSFNVVLQTGLPEEQVIGLAPLVALGQVGTHEFLKAASKRQFATARMQVEEIFRNFGHIDPKTPEEHELKSTIAQIEQVLQQAISDAMVLTDFIENSLVEYSAITKAGRSS